MLANLKVEDITPHNILSESEDDAIFKDMEKKETQYPSIPIFTGDGAAPVYKSRVPELNLSGVSILTDFGKMRIAKEGGNQE